MAAGELGRWALGVINADYTNHIMTTESALRDWRYGQTQAERLVAALLHLEGFEAVDPQHPLGGPDGLKDVLCRKDGLSWVAAAYFPTTPATLTAIKSKPGRVGNSLPTR
ncbi:hypothetical protein Q9292_00265 [Methylophilus sp. VKM B-3414]|nr:hypothetical protein [Methylophilus sp. VKM B-3414]